MSPWNPKEDLGVYTTWCVCRVCVFRKIISNGLPANLEKLIHKKSSRHITRNINDITTYQCRTDAFKFSFFPWTITEWNEIDIKIWNSQHSVFRNYLHKQIRPQPSPLYNICNSSGINLLIRSRLGLINLNEYTSLTTILMIVLRGHPLSTCTKFSEKLTILTPWYAHVCVRIRGLEMSVFRKILRTYLMNDP